VTLSLICRPVRRPSICRARTRRLIRCP